MPFTSLLPRRDGKRNRRETSVIHSVHVGPSSFTSVSRLSLINSVHPTRSSVPFRSLRSRNEPCGASGVRRDESGEKGPKGTGLNDNRNLCHPRLFSSLSVPFSSCHSYRTESNGMWERTERERRRDEWSKWREPTKEGERNGHSSCLTPLTSPSLPSPLVSRRRPEGNEWGGDGEVIT